MSDNFVISCRPRRLRQNELIRALSSESSIEVFDLIQDDSSAVPSKTVASKTFASKTVASPNKVKFHIIDESAAANAVLSLVPQFKQSGDSELSHTVIVDHAKSSLKLNSQVMPSVLDVLHEVRLTLDGIDGGKNSILLAVLLSPHNSPEPSSYFWDELVKIGVDLVIIKSVLFSTGVVCSLKKVPLLTSKSTLSASSTSSLPQARPACLLPVGVLCTPQEQRMFFEADRLGWLTGDRVCTELKGAACRAGAQFLLW